MPAHGAGEHDALQIAPAGDQVLNLVAMRDASYFLFDDGTIVEHRGDVMAGGSDELDAALMGCVVRPRADEGRQKRVVHVDDRGRVTGDEGLGEDLHVARQDDEFHLKRLEHGELLRFGLGTGCWSDWYVFEANAVKCGQRFHFTMIGNDRHDLASQFAGARTMEQVGDAMQVLGAEDRDARAAAASMQLPPHLQFFGQGSKGAGEGGKAISDG